MANTSEEKVVLTAVDQFSAVFKTALRSVESMQSSLETVKSTLGAIGVAVGAGAFVQLQYDALKATAALDDMAEATGASVERLSAIQNVMKVGGQDFAGFTEQIGRAIKGLKQGGEEGSKAAAAYAYLGIQTKDASGRFRDFGDITIELAQKLAQYEDNANKVAIVQDALGKGAERYLPALKDIAEGVDLTSKVTAKQAAEAELAEKNIRRMTLAIEDQRRELVNSYVPALVDVTNQLLAAMKSQGGFWSGIAAWTSVTGGQAQDPLTAMSELDAKLQKLRETKAALSKDSPGAFLNRVFSPEDLAIVDQQIAYAEKQRATLQAILVQRVKRNMTGLSEDAAGNIGPAPSPAKLNYQSPAKEKKSLSPYDSAVLEAQKAIAKAQYGDSDYMSTVLEIEAGKYGELNEKQKGRLLQLAAERDLQKQDADLKKEITQIIERNGEKEVQAAENRRKVLDEYRNLAMSQEEIENEAYRRRLEQLKGYSDEELNNIGGRQAVEQQMEGEHQAKLRQIRAQGLNSMSDFNKASWQQQTSTVVGELANMTSGVAQHNRKLFEINKIAAIANAIISTAAGVTKALEVYPPPLSFVMAAAQAAVGAVQIATIESTQFGSSTAPSVGGTAAPAVSPVFQQAPAGNQNPQTTIVKFAGTQSDQAAVRRFVEALNENTRDGGKILVED